MMIIWPITVDDPISETNAGDDYALWNNTHAATLDDYRLQELDAHGNRNLFHPDAWPFLPH